MSVKVPRGDMNGKTHVGESAIGLQYPKCSGGDSIVEPDIGTLKENFKGCD